MLVAVMLSATAPAAWLAWKLLELLVIGEAL
ncbi:hypothetical protein FHS31_000801 [Sphingomonas vulcanisoli]|uniref:Uncharacterized protein n=1 Tax=Sphingomonas vulcanisoli TaxID=1658060 RepID=A0ABX0TRN8_9SPHN|nr:hypothetical protein [Sphingomonas vulcanisoli]